MMIKTKQPYYFFCFQIHHQKENKKEIKTKKKIKKQFKKIKKRK